MHQPHHQPRGAEAQLGHRIGARDRDRDLEEEDQAADDDAVPQQRRHGHAVEGLGEILGEEPNAAG